MADGPSAFGDGKAGGHDASQEQPDRLPGRPSGWPERWPHGPPVAPDRPPTSWCARSRPAPRRPRLGRPPRAPSRRTPPGPTRPRRWPGPRRAAGSAAPGGPPRPPGCARPSASSASQRHRRSASRFSPSRSATAPRRPIAPDRWPAAPVPGQPPGPPWFEHHRGDDAGQDGGLGPVEELVGQRLGHQEIGLVVDAGQAVAAGRQRPVLDVAATPRARPPDGSAGGRGGRPVAPAIGRRSGGGPRWRCPDRSGRPG